MIYLGIPSYDGTVRAGTYDAALRTCRDPKKTYKLTIRTNNFSLLANNFNGLWCEAVNIHKANKDDVQYFVMLHADIVPEQGWLDKLIEIIKRTKADIVSVVSPIKSSEGVTSTAIGLPNTPWYNVKRLTMHDVYKLPPTFSAADCGYPDNPLLVNTGCFIADLSKPWVHEVRSDGFAAFAFNVQSAITQNKQGYFEPLNTRPEDWEMSRHVYSRGGKILATREVKLIHYGPFGFSNDQAWGRCQSDPCLLNPVKVN